MELTDQTGVFLGEETCSENYALTVFKRRECTTNLD